MSYKDIRQGRERSAGQVIEELRRIGRVGIVNAREDTAAIRAAADLLELLTGIVTETEIRQLKYGEKTVNRIRYEAGLTPIRIEEDFDETRSSGLLEE